MSAAQPESFADFLRPKRAWMAFLFAWTLLGGLVLPLFLSSYYDAFMFGTPEERLIAAWSPVAAASQVTHLGLLDMLRWLPVVVATAGLLVQLALEAVIWWCRLDRRDVAWSSLVWSARSWPAALAWSLGGAALFGVLVSILLFLEQAAGLPGPLILLGLAVPLAWLLSAPFLAGNPANVTRDDPPFRWRLRWPGVIAVGFAIAAIVTVQAIENGLDFAYASVPLEGFPRTVFVLAMFLLSELAGLLLLALVGFAWLNGRNWLSADDCRHAWSGATIGAMLTAWLRALGWLSAAFPVVALVVLHVWVWPQVEEALRLGGGLVSPTWHAVMSATRFAQQWWWLVVLWPGMWLAMVYPGRLFALLGFVRPDGAVGTPTPATRPDSDPAATTLPTA